MKNLFRIISQRACISDAIAGWVRVTALLLLLVVGMENPLRFHHHDCEGYVCLTFPGMDDPHESADHNDDCGESHDTCCDFCTPLLASLLSGADMCPIPPEMFMLRAIMCDIRSVAERLIPYPLDLPERYTPPHIKCVIGRKSPPLFHQF